MKEQISDSRHRLFTLGFDYKVTPDDNLAIIEINGCHSGIKGYIKLHPDAEKIRQGTRYLLNDWLKDKDSLWGFDPDEKDCMERYKAGPPKKAKDWNFGVASDTNFVERVANEKVLSRIVTPDEYCVPGIEWKGNNFDELAFLIGELYEGGSKLVDVENYPFVVFKPAYGTAHGDGIRIFNLRERGKIPHKMCEFIKELENTECKIDYLIEGFVPSKLFENPETGKGHDACGRLVFDIHVDLENSYYNPIFSANYLRLSPENWTDEGFSEGMMKANLTGKVPAIPIDAPDEVSKISTEAGMDTANVLLGTSLYLMMKKKIKNL